MLRFLLRKLPSVALVVFISSIIAFMLPRLAPGDPAVTVAGPDATSDQVELIREDMGLNRPIFQQYAEWIGGLLTGDPGTSYVTRRAVGDLIITRVESTLELALLATIIMITVGLGLGIAAGSPRSRVARGILDVITTVLLATPPFVTGLLLILLLGIAIPILPVSGEVGLLEDPVIGIQYLILPAIALALPQAAVVARLVQTSMQTVRGEDFVDLALAKGVPTSVITRKHVLRNSLSTTVVVIGLRIGDLLAGAIITEAIFARNGLGQLAVTSVAGRDYPVVQVLILGAVVIAILIQLATEIILAVLDPRVRLEGELVMVLDNKDTATAVLATAARPPRVNASLARYLGALKTPRAIIALTLIVILFGIALLAPVLFPEGYDQQTSESLASPSLAHPFGTDELGRDIFTRAIYGLRIDLSLVLVAVPVSMIIGTMLGLLGAVSERLGNLVQRVLDIIVGFPGLILGICVVLVIGPGWLSLAITIVIVGLPSFGRLSRAALLSQQSREYVIAARTLGVSKYRVMLRHILPNAVDPVIVQGSVYVVGAVFLEAGLSIVGLGIQPPEPSLGALLNVGMRYVSAQPAYVLGPTIILILVALAFSLLADALNDSVNRK